MKITVYEDEYKIENSTKPPFEKTMSGLILRINPRACVKPCNTLNGSEKFFQSKYLRNLPELIPWMAVNSS